MAQVNLPSSLSPAFWDKQKAALAKLPKAPATKLPDELKALTKLHLGIDWDAFGADKLSSADEVKERLADLDTAAKGKIKAIGEQAKTVETMASKFEAEAKKDKAFPKDTLTAVAAIIKAAKEYAADLDEARAQAQKALAAKATALATSKGKGAAAVPSTEADPKLVKLVRARILAAIALIKNPKPNARPMRFITVQGKVNMAMMLGVAVGPAQDKQLRSVLAAEAPFKTAKDAQGSVVWEKNAVTFVSDRLTGAQLKKIQAWMKKALKLNPKLRLRNSKGEVEEMEGDEISDDMLAASSADALGADDAAGEYQERLESMAAAIKRAMSSPTGAKIKTLMGSSSQHAKAGQFTDALADLDEIDALLDEGGFADALDTEPETAANAGGGAAARQQAMADALADWKVRRAAAVTALKAVAGQIAAAKHPSSAKAILEIQAVTKNLTPEPTTLQQVNDLRNWLGSDDVVNDVCELAQDVRTPLMVPLERMRELLAA